MNDETERKGLSREVNGDGLAGTDVKVDEISLASPDCDRVVVQGGTSRIVYRDMDGQLAKAEEALWRRWDMELALARKARARAPAGRRPKPSTPVAPRLAETLAGLLCDRSLREPILGDLAELFEERALRRGEKHARAWYWLQVGRSFGPFALRWGRRLAELDDLRQLIGW